MFGNGPFNRYVNDKCRYEWWQAALYINGWLGNIACQGEIWYLACEFWYYLLFPILAFIYSKNQFAGVLSVKGFMLVSIIQNGMVSWILDRGIYGQFNSPATDAHKTGIG